MLSWCPRLRASVAGLSPDRRLLSVVGLRSGFAVGVAVVVVSEHPT